MLTAERRIKVMGINRTLFFVGLVVAWQMGRFDADAQSAGARKVLHAELAKDRESEPATKFPSDTPKIVAFWKGDALKAGDKIRAVWLAEDVGYAELHHTKITEGSAIAYRPDDSGAFGLARPKEGWPLGKYRLELYVGDKLAETLNFTIE
jgi:hypothetical protein